MENRIIPLSNFSAPGKALALETSEGRPVKNQQGSRNIPLQLLRLRTDELHRQFRSPAIQIRTSGSGLYNCFGHVWAGRRTRIEADAEVEKIIADDRYRTIDRTEIKIGDLVLYRFPNGSFIHVAEIIAIGRPESGHQTMVLSKMNEYGEIIHPVDDWSQKDVRIEFITDRPVEEGLITS